MRSQPPVNDQLSAARRRPRSAGTGWLLVACLVAVLVGGVSSTAGAHASLIRSSPSNNEVIDSSPTEIVLVFDEAVRLSDRGVLVLDPEGREVQSGDAVLSENSTTATQPVEGGTAGTYTVSYRLISEDNHVISGSYVFHVGRVTGTAEASESPYDAGWFVGAAGRASFLGGALLGIGAMFVALFVDRRSGESPILPSARVLRAVACLAGAGSVLIVWGLAASLAGSWVPTWSALADALSPAAPFGGPALWGVALALAAVVAVVGGSTRSQASSGVRFWSVVFAVAALGLVPSLTGHVSALRNAAILSDFAHVFGAGAWAGGLLYLAVSHGGLTAVGGELGEAQDGRARLVRFSALATVVVGVVLVSGVINTWVLSGGIRNFLGSIGEGAYSTTLAVKLVIVAEVLVLGWINRRSLSRGSETGMENIWQWVRTEAIAVVGVILATALLVGMVPPRGEAPEEFQGVQQAGEVTVRMQVTPARSGANEVHLYFLEIDGSLRDITAAELRIASDRVEPRRVPLTMVTSSHAIATQVDLTSGMWDFEVTVVSTPPDQSPADQNTTNFEVSIE